VKSFCRNIPFLLAACLLFQISCVPTNNNTGQKPDEGAVPAETVTPLYDIPGLHLLYTVNDRFANTGSAPTARVLIAEPDGSRREILFEFPGHVFHITPSPTGDMVAFVGSASGDAGQNERHLFIYDIKLDTYRDVSLTGLYSRAVQAGPIFSLDGKYVLFLSRRSVDAGEYNIFKCDAETGVTSGLYTDSVEDVPLTMMPDGESCIAVRRPRNTTGVLEYIKVDINTGAAELLHRFENVTKIGPAHVDDTGTTMYCDIKIWNIDSAMDVGANSRDVVSVNLADGIVTNLLEPNTVSYVYQIYRDSSGELSLLLRRQEVFEGEETPLSRIAVCKADGSDLRYLTDTSARAYLYGPPPKNINHLSPDNSLLFFYRQDPLFEHEDIWVMKSDGTDPVNVSDTAGFAEGSAGWIVIPPS
jgi:Tol biopolymer transport system component